MTREIGSDAAIVRGRDLADGFDVGCDVAVVGSGAGGAVVAAHLAEAGRRVIVLEEGPYYRPEEYAAFRPSESMRRMWREAGLQAAFGAGETPVIGLTAGRVVGGSSVLTGGVCFRIPPAVHDDWARRLGLSGLSERALEPAYEDVERRVHVEEVPETARSASTRKFVEGAARLGIPMRRIRRNTMGCQGNARCNFGCPVWAKRSVDVAYLPAVARHGGRIVSDALVERIEVDHGRAAGVRGRLLGGAAGRPGHAFRVRAPIVVGACGTLHTPVLLERSGLSRPRRVLGRGVTLHPAVRVSALFDDRLDGWDGALQSVYSDAFHDDGITLVGVYSTVNVLTAALPGVGPALRRRAAEMPHLGVFGGMVHDEGGGVVRPGIGREPVLSYRMAPRDLARLRRTITILCDIALAAGARRVYTSVFGAPPVTDAAGARRLEAERIDARRIECVAFHPLGSARMATDPARGVVDPWGQSFELPGLYLADGSVLPTSIGVNSQVPIMAMATRIAWGIRDRAAAPGRGGT